MDLIGHRTCAAGVHRPARYTDAAGLDDRPPRHPAHGCTACHGAPGVEWAKFSEGLRPDPPDLSKQGPATPPEQIFWVIKNGIRMTGMPSFGATGVEDPEIWRIAAFVKNFDKVSETDFKTWTSTTTGTLKSPGG
jgi:mono/diheme cytochrome c family protein